jgi:hypothetical protein
MPLKILADLRHFAQRIGIAMRKVTAPTPRSRKF